MLAAQFKNKWNYTENGVEFKNIWDIGMQWLEQHHYVTHTESLHFYAIFSNELAVKIANKVSMQKMNEYDPSVLEGERTTI